MKRLLVTLAALLLAAATLASCTRAEAKVEVSCDGNITEQAAKTEAELADAQADAKDAEGTPAESDANNRVSELEAQLETLRACAQNGTTPTSALANCPEGSWARVDSDKTGHRWFANGIPSIAEAVTPEQAQAAAHDWFSATKQDPVTLSGAVKYLIDRDVNQAELFDSNGCATQIAVDLVAEAESALALSLYKAEEAPSNGYNSGASDSNVTSSAKPGIRGDRRAVKIVTPKGVTIWVMYRCGNPVTMRPHPKVPKGPTDENPPKVTPTTRPVPPTTRPVTPTTWPVPPTTRPVPPTTRPVPPTTRLTPKDPSKDINRNPAVPPQVRKDQPSPDNKKRIETGPTKPVDTPSGCSGSCPTAPPTTRPATPTAPPTTRPVSIGGNTGITPPPTVAPPVAPPVTSSPTVTVVSP